MRLKLFKVIRSECDRQLFLSVDIVKYGYANSISTLFLSFFECMSTSTVDIDRRPIFFVWTDRHGRYWPISGYYEPNRPSILTVILRRCNQTDRRYRPCCPVGGTEPTININLDQPNGWLKPTDRTDETCANQTKLTNMQVLRTVVPIPAFTSASVLHSSTVGGSVVGVVIPSRHLGNLTTANRF